MADEVIYASGDVVLVTGPDESPQRFRVSSVILSCASSVFRTVLGSAFAEGQEQASSGTITKRLEGDDTKAMRIASITILNVAIIADKYDCSRALSFILTKWCDRFKNSHFWNGAEIHIPEWVDILAATYLNGLHELFGFATERLIFSYAGNFHHLAKDHRAWISDHVLICLDVAR
ncbi:hypothetical protein B9Z65_5104 [Elsinoe australis]|uniref:BTB domain-containing protein n=1 Tax=Elsinoe australis TaxID=40998 RepID=A0A2P7ZD41_9PEZI|nr:hypothetical protein B9Z65_5104 [Elsinoe australis]